MATKQSKAARAIINVDELQKILRLPAWDSIEEMNLDFIAENGDEEAAQKELYHQWHDSVTFAADSIFETHGLILKPIGRERAPYEYAIRPEKTWEDAAYKIIDTINGVGLFYVNNLRELLDVGPYRNARHVVLEHLGVLEDRSEVYGTASAQRLYDTAWRR